MKRPRAAFRVLMVGLSIGAAACGGPEGRHRVDLTRSCAERPGGSRWAGVHGYRVTAEYGGDADQPLWRVLGVAASDSVVYVFDGPNYRVHVLGHDLRLHRAFGRRGDGPGEFGSLSRGFYPADQNDRWVEVSGDSVFVFSGDRLQIFSAEGRFLTRAGERQLEDGTLSLRTNRVRRVGGSLYFADPTYRYGRTADERKRMRVMRGNANGTASVLDLAVTPLPTSRGPSGPTMMLRGQARASWDLRGDCMVATPGADGRLVVASASARGVADTIEFPLPRVALPPDDEGEDGMLAAASRGQMTENLRPTAGRRIDAVTIDPDGYVWVLPYQNTEDTNGRSVVLKVSLRSGRAEVDTVPAFPLEFGAPGTYFGLRKTETGEPVVVRVEADHPG